MLRGSGSISILEMKLRGTVDLKESEREALTFLRQRDVISKVQIRVK